MENYWFSVRCIFKHSDIKNQKKDFIYEERITIWKATSFEEAVVLAEQEAKTYSKDSDCSYTGLSQIFKIRKNNIKNGSEIFSLMRESDKDEKEYLDNYFDCGEEKLKRIFE